MPKTNNKQLRIRETFQKLEHWFRSYRKPIILEASLEQLSSCEDIWSTECEDSVACFLLWVRVTVLWKVTGGGGMMNRDPGN